MRRERCVSKGAPAAALVVAMIILLPACSAGPSTPEEEPSPMGFTNPVYDLNFPDPMVIDDPDGSVWAFATNDNGNNVQVLHSADLKTWEPASDALPTLGEWSTPGKVWAPEVAVHADDRYVMYYTTRAPDPEIQCIGVAVATDPEGPYVDSSKGPLVCHSDEGGSIDAHPFTDADGTRYLYWKNEGNAIGIETWLEVATLSEDGLTLTSEPTRLLKNDLPWEGNLIEGPFVWLNEGVYHLFYSGNAFGSADYAVGHAVADNPLGPFTKDEQPILVSNEVAAGPGHNALFRRGDRVWTSYHAWHPESIMDYPGRVLWLSEVTFDGTTARIEPPTTQYPVDP